MPLNSDEKDARNRELRKEVHAAKAARDKAMKELAAEQRAVKKAEAAAKKAAKGGRKTRRHRRSRHHTRRY